MDLLYILATERGESSVLVRHENPRLPSAVRKAPAHTRRQRDLRQFPKTKHPHYDEPAGPAGQRKKRFHGLEIPRITHTPANPPRTADLRKHEVTGPMDNPING